MEPEDNKKMSSDLAQYGSENKRQLTETERRAAEEIALIEEAERKARTYIDDKGRSFVDGVYIDEKGRKTVDYSHLGFFESLKASWREGTKGNKIEYDREAFLERRKMEIKKLRRQQERIYAQAEDGVTGDFLFKAFGIDKDSLSDARRQDLESIAHEYANPATRDKARSLFVKMIREYSRVDKLAEKASGKEAADDIAAKKKSLSSDDNVSDQSEREKQGVAFEFSSWQKPAGVKVDIEHLVDEVREFLAAFNVSANLANIFVSPFAVTCAINLDERKAKTGRPQLLLRLQEHIDACGYPTVVKVMDSLPETSSIGIGIHRSHGDDTEPSLTAMVDSDEYKKLIANSNAVPIVLGIDHMNKPLVIDMSDGDNMVIIGSDTLDQSYTTEVIVNGLIYGRSPYDLQLTVLDAREHAPQSLGWCAGYPYSRNSISNPPTNRNLGSWCKRATAIFEEIKHDCSVRRRMIVAAGCSNIEEYNTISGRNLPRRVVLMANFPGRSNDASIDSRTAIDSFKESVVSFIGSNKADVGVHFILWNFAANWADLDDASLVEALMYAKDNTHFIAYTRFDEIGSCLNFAGGHEACYNNFAPLVYRSPDGNIHYFLFAKVRKEERNLAVDKWGVTRTVVNDNIPDDDNSETEREKGKEYVEIEATGAGEDDDNLPPHIGELGCGWAPQEDSEIDTKCDDDDMGDGSLYDEKEEDEDEGIGNPDDDPALQLSEDGEDVDENGNAVELNDDGTFVLAANHETVAVFSDGKKRFSLVKGERKDIEDPDDDGGSANVDT